MFQKTVIVKCEVSIADNFMQAIVHEGSSFIHIKGIVQILRQNSKSEVCKKANS